MRDITVQLHPDAGGLAISYRIEGGLEDVVLPEPRPGERADGLWQHTCFELFIAQAGSDAYQEFNFSPSGDWAAYRFDRYREPSAAGHAGPVPRIATRRSGRALQLEASVGLCGSGPRRLAISAVIEERDGLSYWALAHPDGNPDFHDPVSFVLELRR